MLKSEYIKEAINKRRSVYPEVFNDEPISEEELVNLLALANAAPTHKLTEPWRFKVIAGDRKTAFGQLLADNYKENTAAPDFKEMKYKKKMKRANKSAYVVAICMHRAPDESLPEWEDLAAVAMAVQNIWVAGYAEGIGMYWGSPKTALDDQAMRSFLELEETERCLGFLFMGRFPQDLELQSPRTPFKEKLKWLR